MDEIRALAVSGFGGAPEASLRRGLERDPHYIGCDMGTVDLGPYYLGSGTAGGVTDSDLALLVETRDQAGIPLLCGSAGIAGGRPHLDNVTERMITIMRERKISAKVVTIDTEVDKDELLTALKDGLVAPLGPVPELTAGDVEDCVRVVGQIGPEPYMQALQDGADIVLGGRACDTSPFVAMPKLQGFDVGLTYHMAKIIECASLCSVPGGRDSILGTLRHDSFELESMNPDRACTPVSVAAHSLYEQPDPYVMLEPGGALHTEGSTYEAVSERVTRVSGSVWKPADQYTIKLEGVRRTGHRYFCIAGVRDAGVIANLPVIERTVTRSIEDKYGPVGSDYRLAFRVYGRDGVLGSREFQTTPSHEVCVLIDVVAQTQSLAKEICALAKQNTMHCGFEGRLSTAGNVAYPFSPEIHSGGETFEFNVYHIVSVSDPMSFSSLTFHDVK